MRITAITSQKKNTSRFNLEIDGRFFCGVGPSTIANFYLHQNKEIEEALLNDILSFEIYNRFYDRAISYVTGSYKTEYDVRIYLKKLFKSKKEEWISDAVNFDIDGTIQTVILRLVELGMINDSEYARLFISSRLKNKPRSKMVIASELRKKGISKDIIDSAIRGIDDDDAIYNLYIRKYGEIIFDIHENQKIVGFLARKGFSWDEISKLETRLKDDFGK